MLAVISRVHNATLESNRGHMASIKKGLVLLVGVAKEDTEKEANLLISKVLKMRLFDNDAGKMDFNLLQIKAELLLVSQFTLFANVRRGTRPSFSSAANPSHAKTIYSYLINSFKEKIAGNLKTGDFGNHMDINVMMDGPITIHFEV